MALTGITRPSTVTKLASGSGNYTTPAGVRFLRGRMVGGGGGGGAGQGGTGGTAGGTTSFGSFTAVGGAVAAAGQGNGNTGNIPGGTGGSGSAVIRIPGNPGANGTLTNGGGRGADAPFFGGGAPAVFTTANAAGAGLNGVANTGGGGSGAFSTTNGGGGGSGEYVEFLITPTAGQVFAYSVGVGGTGQTPGGAAGGNGGSGVIYIDEIY